MASTGRVTLIPLSYCLKKWYLQRFAAH